jgi:colanic acid/amylovoran biosynthesis glycosyltransferase
MKSLPPQKIGYVVKMFPRLSETFIRNEILELERQGLALRIFSLKRPTEADLRLAGGGVQAPIIYLPERVYREPLRVLRAQLGVLRRYPRGYRRMLLHVLRRREMSSLARGLRRFCQTCCLVHEKGDVEHLHAHFASDPTRLASWAQMICKSSYSITTHAKDLYQDDRIGSPGLRNKLTLARFVVANSEYSAAGLRAIFNGAAPTKIFTIYNSVDLAAFPRRLSEPSEPLILSVGRLVEKKGFADLIQACRLLKDWGMKFNCDIVGSGPLGASLSDCIANLGLEKTVKLRGQKPHHELRTHYLKAMVFALPCVVADNGDRDILPNVLKEAMAVGVPVVTTRLEGIEELVTHEETGLLTNSGDIEALAKSLQQLLTDAELRRRLANQARRLIEERFNLQANFTRLRQLLGEMIEERAGTIVQSQKTTV